MKLKNNSNRAYIGLILLILATSIFLRFYGINNKTLLYGGDRVRDLTAVYKKTEFLRNFEYTKHNLLDIPNAFRAHNLKYWLPSGPIISVTWQTLSPLYYILLAPVFIISSYSDLSAIVATYIANILTLVLLMYTAKINFGKQTSILSGIIYGFSYLVIREAGIGLNPGLVPFFTILSIHAILRAKTSATSFLWASLSFVGLISFHASGIIFLPIFVICYLLQKPKITKKYLFAGILTILFGIGLYILQERMLSGYNITIFKDHYGLSKTDKDMSINFISILKGVWNTVYSFSGTVNYSLFPISDLPTVTVYLMLGVISFLEYRSIPRKTIKITYLLLAYLVTMGVIVNPSTGIRTDWWFAPVAIPLFVIIASNLFSLGFRRKYTIPIMMNIVFIFTLLNVAKSVNESKAKDIKSRSVGKSIAKKIAERPDLDLFSLQFDTKDQGRDRGNYYDPYLYLIAKEKKETTREQIAYFYKIFDADKKDLEQTIIITDKLELYDRQDYETVRTKYKNIGILVDRVKTD